jgi:enoyl-CoA hydratase
VTIEVEHDGAVLVATFNRPERRNAIDLHTAEALADLIDRRPPEVRVVVLTGAGGAFSAGADVSAVEGDHFRAALGRALRELAGAPVITVAAVDGPALGAGLQVCLACDVRIATDRARFGLPAAKLGVMVDTWTVGRMAAMLGHATARAMLVTAGSITAHEALALGFVQRLGSLADARALAQEWSALAPLTVAGHKLVSEELLAFIDSPAALDALDRAWSSTDAEEGRQAFGEKRPPRFTGR